jgi:hypothetical protein
MHVITVNCVPSLAFGIRLHCPSITRVPQQPMSGLIDDSNSLIDWCDLPSIKTDFGR